MPISPREQLLRARREGRCAFIPYLTLGWPDLDSSLRVLTALENLGVDVVELGIPFSDPVADGPTIQRTTDRALSLGVNLRVCLERLRAQPTAEGPQGQAARVLFSYFNPLHRRGLDTVCAALPGAGIGGALITDLIPEEAGEWHRATDAMGIERAYLVAITSDAARLEQAARMSSGFVYCVSTLGVTGARKGEVDPRARHTVDLLRQASDVPVAVGFGISRPADVLAVREYADGAIVGSALLEAMGEDPTDCVQRAVDFVGPMLEAAHQ